MVLRSVATAIWNSIPIRKYKHEDLKEDKNSLDLTAPSQGILDPHQMEMGLNVRHLEAFS